MKTFLECWIEAATALFAQALAGEPQLGDALPKPLSGRSFGFAATLAGDQAGRFSVVLDGTILSSPLLGEGTDQKAGWAELLREVVEAACGDLLATAGKKCRVEPFEPIAAESKITRAFQLRATDRAWTVLVRDEVHSVESEVPPAPARSAPESAQTQRPERASRSGLSPGVELLLDVELAASLRFGSREISLAEILDLGPGDVVQLDRHVADPVDLVVGDKIVARGEVVLVNGNFGLRVTEVSQPLKRLESIRCLF